jgi:hypothetical protein
VATELVRRNPKLDLFESYPLEGFYNCLTLWGELESGPIHIDMNRLGSIHVHPEHIAFMSGADVIANQDAHWAVKEIERAAGLHPSEQAPSSNARVIALRVMARTVNYLINDRSTWSLRMMTPDGYGWSLAFQSREHLESPTPPFTGMFPTARSFRSFLVESGMPAEFEPGRLWALTRDEVAVAIFDTKGVVRTRETTTRLKPLYARLNRNLTQTMAVALADVLP